MWNWDRRHWLLLLQIVALLSSHVNAQDHHLFQPTNTHKMQQQALQQRGDENCETLQSEIQLIKGEKNAITLGGALTVF